MIGLRECLLLRLCFSLRVSVCGPRCPVTTNAVRAGGQTPAQWQSSLPWSSSKHINIIVLALFIRSVIHVDCCDPHLRSCTYKTEVGGPSTTSSSIIRTCVVINLCSATARRTGMLVGEATTIGASLRPSQCPYTCHEFHPPCSCGRRNIDGRRHAVVHLRLLLFVAPFQASAESIRSRIIGELLHCILC